MHIKYIACTTSKKVGKAKIGVENTLQYEQTQLHITNIVWQHAWASLSFNFLSWDVFELKLILSPTFPDKFIWSGQLNVLKKEIVCFRFFNEKNIYTCFVLLINILSPMALCLLMKTRARTLKSNYHVIVSETRVRRRQLSRLIGREGGILFSPERHA